MAGLEICCVDTSFEVANPSASIEEAHGFLELAADLESPLIRLFGGAPAGEPVHTSVRRAAERMSLLARRGRTLGVRAALETHDSFAAGAATAAVLAGAADEFAVAIYDTLNPFVAGEPPEQTLSSLGDRLALVHVKDGGAEPDTEECRLLGEGRVPIRWILGALARRGYEGWLSIEWEKLWQPQIAEPEVALPQYAETLGAYLTELE